MTFLFGFGFFFYIKGSCSLMYSFYEGLKEEGLFRLPGHVEKVASLKDAFNKGIDVFLAEFQALFYKKKKYSTTLLNFEY